MTQRQYVREEAIMEDSPENHEQVAGNGLLHRRMFLSASVAAGAAAVGASVPSSVISISEAPRAQ